MSKANDDVKVNKKYKDSLFRKLFGENEENALSLYNAINGTNYSVEDGFEYTTLEDVIYMKIKNDVSFLIGVTMSLYEHQSSYNPNMALRGFMYYADLYRKIIKQDAKIYGRTLVKIPNPDYVVFYNGPETDMPEEQKFLKLSDSFENPISTGEYEWTAKLININAGRNKQLKEKCHVLCEYVTFIGLVKQKLGTNELEKAIDTAVEECIKEGILVDFLKKHRMEVKNMLLTEFDEVAYEEYIRAESRAEGKAEGKAKVNELNLALMKQNRIDDIVKAAQDQEYQEKLFQEFNL